MHLFFFFGFISFDSRAYENGSNQYLIKACGRFSIKNKLSFVRVRVFLHLSQLLCSFDFVVCGELCVVVMYAWVCECARQIATAWHQMKSKWQVGTDHVQKIALPWSSKERQRNCCLFMATVKRAARRQMQRRPTNFPLKTFCVIAAVFSCSVFT